jgi:hypothetical protein
MGVQIPIPPLALRKKKKKPRELGPRVSRPAADAKFSCLEATWDAELARYAKPHATYRFSMHHTRLAAREAVEQRPYADFDDWRDLTARYHVLLSSVGSPAEKAFGHRPSDAEDNVTDSDDATVRRGRARHRPVTGDVVAAGDVGVARRALGPLWMTGMKVSALIFLTGLAVAALVDASVGVVLMLVGWTTALMTQSVAHRAGEGAFISPGTAAYGTVASLGLTLTAIVAAL